VGVVFFLETKANRNKDIILTVTALRLHRSWIINMAGIALKIEDLDRAKYYLDGAEGTIVEAEDKFYFVTKWTQELADSLYCIDYELVLFNDSDSMMLKEKIEEKQRIRDHIAANYSAEEIRSMQQYLASPEFKNLVFEGAKRG